MGTKVSTIYSRGEARDYLDLDAIRSSGLFSDEQLVTAAAARDGGFEVGMFAQQLAGVRWLTPPEVSPYGRFHLVGDQHIDIGEILRRDPGNGSWVQHGEHTGRAGLLETFTSHQEWDLEGHETDVGRPERREERSDVGGCQLQERTRG